MKKAIKFLLVVLVFGFMFFEVAPFFINSQVWAVSADKCGMNIDPINPKGFPSAQSLPSGSWVRIEFKDCSPDNPDDSIAYYSKIVNYYKSQNNIKTLLIIDYSSYHSARTDLEGFGQRAGEIVAGVNPDAVELWNEPDLAHVGDLSETEFAAMVKAVAPNLGGTQIVLGGFASGVPQYAATALGEIGPINAAVGIHPYGKGVGPGGSVGNYFGTMSKAISDYQSAAGGKSIWITEAGIQDKSILPDYITGTLNENVSRAFMFAWHAGSSGESFSISDHPQSLQAYFSACGGGTAPTPQTANVPNLPEYNVEGICEVGDGASGELGIPADRHEFYIEPIKGLATEPDLGQTELGDPEQIFEDLLAQGYQVMCNAPETTYEAIFDGDLEKIELDQGELTITAEQAFDYIDSKIPAWRKQGIYVVNDQASLEGLWSFQQSNLRTNQFAAERNSAIENLLSLEQKCDAKLKILRAIREKCEWLKYEEGEGMEHCALNFEIEGTDFTTIKLLEELNQGELDITGFGGGPLQYTIGDEAIEGMCQNMANPEGTYFDESVTDNASNIAVKNAILRVPLTIPNAYRFAFLVISAELDDGYGEEISYGQGRQGRIDDKQQDEEGPKLGFRFLNALFDNDRISSVPRHDVRVLVFKIPDFATNHYRNEKEWSRTVYSDALELTRDVLLPEGKPKEMEDEAYNHYFGGFEINYDNVDQLESLDKEIDCLDKGLEESRTEGSTVDSLGGPCSLSLPRALTNYINASPSNMCPGTDPNKEKDNYEEVDTIMDSGEINKEDGGIQHRIFAPDGGEIILKPELEIHHNMIFNMETQWVAQQVGNEDPYIAPFNFLSTYQLPTSTAGDNNKDKGDKQYTIKSYLVAPYGYNLDTIQNTLRDIFLTDEQQDNIADIDPVLDPNSPEYLKRFFKVDALHTASDVGDSKRVELDIPITQCPYTEDEYGNPVYDCTETVTARIDTSDQIGKEPRIPGVILGHISMMIQQVINPYENGVFDYIEACKASDKPVENFLLGQCNAPIPEKEPSTFGPDEYMNKAVATCTQGVSLSNSAGEYAMNSSSENKCEVADSVTGVQGGAKLFTEKQSIEGWLDSDDFVTCNEELYSAVACTFNPDTRSTPSYALIAHKVNSATGEIKENGDTTLCEYVQQKASDAGISPRLALAMWGEETGFSSYVTTNSGSDFGVVSASNSRQSGSLDSQISLFLGTIDNYINEGSAGYTHFLLQYSGEEGWRDWTPGEPAEFCLNQAFPGRLKNWYEQLGAF